MLDPERRQPVDHFVMADSSTLVLRAANVGLDVARFLELASEATQLAARDGLLAAEPTLTEAERLYAGDFLEGDLYEDWAVTRGAARSAALEISRLLARGAVQRGDEEAAARHLRGLLERDGYDEDAWLALVGSLSRMRRYGEARRQHMLYARRMAELEIAPVPLTDARDATP